MLPEITLWRGRQSHILLSTWVPEMGFLLSECELQAILLIHERYVTLFINSVTYRRPTRSSGVCIGAHSRRAAAEVSKSQGAAAPAVERPLPAHSPFSQIPVPVLVQLYWWVRVPHTGPAVVCHGMGLVPPVGMGTHQYQYRVLLAGNKTYESGLKAQRRMKECYKCRTTLVFDDVFRPLAHTHGSGNEATKRRLWGGLEELVQAATESVQTIYKQSSGKEVLVETEQLQKEINRMNH